MSLKVIITAVVAALVLLAANWLVDLAGGFTAFGGVLALVAVIALVMIAKKIRPGKEIFNADTLIAVLIVMAIVGVLSTWLPILVFAGIIGTVVQLALLLSAVWLGQGIAAKII